MGNNPLRRLNTEDLAHAENSITGLAFSRANGSNLVHSFGPGARHPLQWYNLLNNMPGAVFAGGLQKPYCLKFSSNGKMLAWAEKQRIIL